MNIFVSKLNSITQNQDLVTAFEIYGRVSTVKVVIDKLTNKPRGFGFVEMDNEDEAKEDGERRRIRKRQSCPLRRGYFVRRGGPSGARQRKRRQGFGGAFRKA